MSMTSVVPARNLDVTWSGACLLFAASAALAFPALLGANVAPSVTFFNQASALLFWGVFLALLIRRQVPRARMMASSGLLTLQGAFAILFVSVLAAPFWAGSPWSLALSSAGLVAAAGLTLQVAASVGSAGFGPVAFRAFCVGMVVAGLASLALGLMQYFAPQWADGYWIARAATPGRVGGNLRQPNHLSSLLLWSLAALLWLHDDVVERGSPHLRRGGRPITAILAAALVFGVVLTVSRTGAVCIVLMALWGVFDRRLSLYARVLLWLAPLAYALCWVGVAEWAAAGAHAFGGDDQLHKSDLSSSRFGIWSNALSLIAQHPWRGVGWGEFNYAWSLTPFPGRPGAFFDHTHNLPLNFLVELGIPLGTLVLGFMAWALWKALAAARLAGSTPSTTAVRCALVMVLMMVVHSMLEYPLWYAYFLLPTAFAFGICLGHAGSADKAGGSWLVRQRCGILLLGALLMTISGPTAVIDYLRVSVVFSPMDNPPSLAARIAEGQRSWFFAHHADYAAATTVEHPSDVMPVFRRAPHYLLDTRLMLAWARAYAEQGDLERARYLSERIKEFRNPQSDEFFEACEHARKVGDSLPFQCTPSTRKFTYEDFRQR